MAYLRGDIARDLLVWVGNADDKGEYQDHRALVHMIRSGVDWGTILSSDEVNNWPDTGVWLDAAVAKAAAPGGGQK